MRRVLTIVGIAIVVALGGTVLITLLVWRYQERVVFQPPQLVADAPAPARRVTYTAQDGHSLFGYVLSPPKPRPPETLVIAFHGNADMAAWTVPWARELVERTGVTVFLPEYRGYAGIPGTPTYITADADARGALAFARAELPSERVILFGHSLGSAVASELALAMNPTPPDALVLQSPFTTAGDMAARLLVPPIPWLWRQIARVHYDTRGAVRRLDARVSVAHGTRDLNIPVWMGRQVFYAARHPGILLLVEGAGHNDVAEVGGERYWRWLADAIAPASDARR